MDQWGEDLGSSDNLTLEEKAEILAAFYAGYLREQEAFGYCRAFSGMLRSIPGGFAELETVMPFDLVRDIKKSQFSKLASESLEDFEARYAQRLDLFKCPRTGITF